MKRDEDHESNDRLIAAAHDIFSIVKLSLLFREYIGGEVGFNNTDHQDFARSLGWDGIEPLDHFITNRQKRVVAQIEGEKVEATVLACLSEAASLIEFWKYSAAPQEYRELFADIYGVLLGKSDKLSLDLYIYRVPRAICSQFENAVLSRIRAGCFVDDARIVYLTDPP